MDTNENQSEAVVEKNNASSLSKEDRFYVGLTSLALIGLIALLFFALY